MQIKEALEVVRGMSPAQRRELAALVRDDMVKRPWRPLPGPQTQAYLARVDVLGYGGSAGGGKSDLAIGKALTQHKRSAIFRRVGTELLGIVDRMEQIIGNREGYNGKDNVWRVAGRTIEFGAVPIAGDEKKFQGRPKSLLAIDEATSFLEKQVRFLMGWVRSENPDEPTMTLMTFNPPTDSDGMWVIDFFGPWLDPKHPNPAKPGEVRWFATLGIDDTQHDIEVPDGRPFIIVNGHHIYDPRVLALYTKDEIIHPQSRTFIPSRVTDNVFYAEGNYIAQLQALPEPLRSQMLYGDFTAGMQDSPMQVIPTAWVQAAMDRWKPLEDHKKLRSMDSVGVDIARGGRDKTVIARRHGRWFDVPVVHPGKDTPNGPVTASLIIAELRNEAVVHLDAIGVGSSPYDFLQQIGVNVVGVIMSETATNKDQSGLLSFKNIRSQLWWSMREALDPANGFDISLPPDRQLLVELCAPEWKLQGRTIYVESREDIVDRIGRSPDLATAYVLALTNTPRASVAYRVGKLGDASEVMKHDPFDNAAIKRQQYGSEEHDPFANLKQAG